MFGVWHMIKKTSIEAENDGSENTNELQCEQ